MVVCGRHGRRALLAALVDAQQPPPPPDIAVGATDIGVLGGAITSGSYAVRDDGLVAGFYETAGGPNQDHAFVWTGAGPGPI